MTYNAPYDPFGTSTDPAYADPQYADPDRNDETNSSSGSPDPAGQTLMERIQGSDDRRTFFGGPGGLTMPQLSSPDYSDTITRDSIIGYYWDAENETWIKARVGDLLDNGFPVPMNLTQSEAEEWLLSYPQFSRAPGQTALDTYWGDTVDGTSTSGGGGGGGGSRTSSAQRQFVAPNYVPPARSQVEDQVRAYVVAVTGLANETLIDQAVDAYLKADKENFDAQVSGERGRVIDSVSTTIEQTDPWNAAKKMVQGTAAYETIHELRPDSVDEMEWVTGRQAKLRSLGLSAERAERLGIKQAQAGANDEALRDAGEMQFVADTGRLLQSQRESLKQSANAVLGLV